MKKLLILTALFSLLLPNIIQAETLHNYYFRIQGGVRATSSQMGEGDVSGTISAGFLRPVYKDQIAVGGSFESIKNAGSDWNNYSGRVYFFSKSIEKVKVSSPGSGGGLIEKSKTQLYLFTGLGGTHESGGAFAEASFAGGVGVMFPLMGATSLVEFEASQMKKDWFFGLTVGGQIGLDF